MYQLLKTVLVVNVIIASMIFALSQFLSTFDAACAADVLFFIVVITWFLAKLSWEGGLYAKSARHDDVFTDSVYSMVKGHDFDEESRQFAAQNYQLGFVLFVAGLPAFIACIVLNLI